MVHQDGSSRPLYTGPGWKPDFDNEEQLEEVIIEVEVDPLIPKSSGLAPWFSPVAASAASSSSTFYSSFISTFGLFFFAIASFFDA